MKIIEIRNQILKKAKPLIAERGWNENLFENIAKKSEYNFDELNALFPGGYLDLLNIFLDSLNDRMTRESKKIDLFRIKTHLRIREIFIVRLKIMLKEKKIISKTFIHLLLPQNYKFALKNLYKTTDQIWYLAGDNSTDFNYYSKRAILGSIYTSTIMHFINNESIEDTIRFLDLQLKQVSKIPKLKNSFKEIINLAPKLIKLKNFYSYKSKQ